MGLVYIASWQRQNGPVKINKIKQDNPANNKLGGYYHGKKMGILVQRR